MVLPPSTRPIYLATGFYQPFGPDDDEQIAALMWELDDSHFAVLHPNGSPSHAASRPLHGRSLLEAAQEVFYTASDVKLITAPLRPGEYHPRLWRNGIAESNSVDQRERSFHAEELVEARQRVIAFHRLQRMLGDVFEVVTPQWGHLAVHGAAIQQVLMLAARELESLFHGPYMQNHASPVAKPNLGTYRCLKDPLRLDQWWAYLDYYEDLGAFRPFFGWTQHESPPWWTAYNKLKHEPGKAGLADLHSAIQAVLAVRVLLEAQFGPRVERMLPEPGVASIRIARRPVWTPNELYFPPSRLHVEGAFRPRKLFA